MNNITLYTTHCPLCKALKAKLDEKQISYNVCEDIKIMIEKGFHRAPMLEVEDKILTYKEALAWLEDK